MGAAPHSQDRWGHSIAAARAACERSSPDGYFFSERAAASGRRGALHGRVGILTPYSAQVAELNLAEMNRRDYSPRSIGILTPHAAQVAELRRALVSDFGPRVTEWVEVSNVDSFQARASTSVHVLLGPPAAVRRELPWPSHRERRAPRSSAPFRESVHSATRWTRPSEPMLRGRGR